VNPSVRARDVRNRLVARGGAPTGNREVADRARVPRWFTTRLDDLAVTADPIVVWRVMWLAVALTGGGATASAGPAVAGLVLMLGGGLVALGLEFHRGRADRLVDAGLPAVLDRVTSGLRAGLGLSVALGDSVPPGAGPLRRDLADVVATLAAGMPLAAALDRWRSWRPTPGIRLVTAALAMCALTGGRSKPLDGVASTLRDRLAVDRELRAVTAQLRVSAIVLVAMPWVFVSFAVAQDVEMLAFLTGTVPGMACLGGAIVLDLAAAGLMARIVRCVR
jgi:tight adherence protein B